MKCKKWGKINPTEAIFKQLSQQNHIPIKKTIKLLIVEDGSIDIDACEQDLLDMGIKILVYRQGAEPPRLYDLEEKK